jgi:mRNA-degrading endonuclease RelE of RelBE toxin-antitoxin system
LASQWKIEFDPRARRELFDLPDSARKEVVYDILALRDDPTPADSVPLRRLRDYYRIYVNRSRYRVIYRLLGGRRVLILRVRPRPTAYQGLEKWGHDRTNPDEVTITLQL